MNDEAPLLEFGTREDFRSWLYNNHSVSGGIWILFTKGRRSFTANDALEEAICFGWIDGLMKSADERRYKKYFSRRRDKSNWSGKNRLLFAKLKEYGMMTEYGIEAFQPEEDGKESKDGADVHSNNINALKNALRSHDGILYAFERVAASRQKQQAGFYCEAKTEKTREKRIAKIIEALKSNNRGMLY